MISSKLMAGLLCLLVTAAGARGRQPEAEPAPAVDVTIGFAGDINLDEDWATTKFLDETGKGIEGVFSPALIDRMRGFDFFMVNNEFTYSTRGSQIEKSYHFRARPERAGFLRDMGADLVLLANNHVFDYGEEALLDTLDTLDACGIPHVGAGRDLDGAQEPHVFTVNNRRIAFVGATAGEQYEASIHTRAAGENLPGVLECYDPSLYLDLIRRTAAENDYVIASIHWGMEYEEQYRTSQRELAEKMVEAGADAVIGTHTHCLQGINMIGDAPVFYSLGNFWFNEKQLYSGMAELTLHVPLSESEPVTLSAAKFLPCTQYSLFTSLCGDPAEKQQILDHVASISEGRIRFEEDGTIAACDQP